MSSVLEELRAIRGETPYVSGTSVLEELRRIRESKPTSSDLTEKIFPQHAPEEQQPRSYGTSLIMTPRMRAAEKAADTEFQNIRTAAFRSGQGEEFEQFMEQQGRVGAIGTWNYVTEDIVTPIFDLLSIGNYTVAGATQEYLRTGSSWEAFKQAGVEFANALPGLELEGARRPSFTDIFGDGDGDWSAAVGGFALDVILDPINLVPGVAVAKAVSRAGRAGLDAAGPLGRLFETTFMRTGRMSRDLKNVSSKHAGAGRQVLKHELLLDADRANMLLEEQDRLDELFGSLRDEEALLLGTWLDSGQLARRLDEAAVAGIIDKENIPAATAVGKKLQQHWTKYFSGEVDRGVVHHGMFRNNYVPHYEAVGRRTSRAQKRLIADRKGISPHDVIDDVPARSSSGVAGGNPGRMAEAQARSVPTTAERLVNILDGIETGGVERTIELDIRNVAKLRAVSHVKQVTWRKFLDNIVNDTQISKKIDMAPDYMNGRQWTRRKQELQKGNPGYKVMEITRKNIAHGEKVDEVTGAYLVPEMVHDYVARVNNSFNNEDAVGRFMTFIQDQTNMWKGWATFGTGYIARNIQSSGFVNWQAGVGRDYKKLLKGEFPGTAFHTRYLQGLRVQLAANGSGRMPQRVKDAADAIARRTGHDNFMSIPLPKLKNEAGELMESWEEIAAAGEKWGVPKQATRVFDLPEGAQRQMWQGLGKIVDVSDLEKLSPDHLTRRAFELSGKADRDVWEGLEDLNAYMKAHLGTESKIIKANRAAAQITENQARWALWIDRVEKGSTHHEGAMATNLWHFDYTNLTDTEKRVFRVVMPFYAWTRFNVPRQMMALIENPGRMSRVPKFKNAVESLSADMEGVQQPDYYSEVQAMNLGFIERDKPLFAQLDLPPLDLNRLGPNEMMSNVNPMLKLAVEQIPKGGYSFFMDAPIERFPGEMSEGLPITRKTEATLTTMFPPLGKFVTRPLRAYDRGELAEQLLSELTGARMRSLDVRRATRANTFARREVARLYKRRMEQEVRRGRQ